jgi:hypothetical protein
MHHAVGSWVKLYSVVHNAHFVITIYAPLIYTAPYIMFCIHAAYPLRGQVGGGWALEIEEYTAPCIMFWMHAAYPLRGQVGGGWALEIESFSGPVK